jgi:hypothetical protein
MFVIYLLPIFIGLTIYIYYKKISVYRGILILGLFNKIIFAYSMTYLVINRYGFGDLPTYYSFAKKISISWDFKYEYLLSGSYFVGLLNGVIFTVLPPSIYGLATISGLSSFIYCYCLIITLGSYLIKNHKLKATALILFLPVFSAQSGYIGKETYVLPLMGYIIYNFFINNRLNFKLIACIIVIGLIRPYQALVLISSFILTAIYFNAESIKFKNIFTFSILISISYILFGSYLINQLNLIFEFGAEEYLSITYSDGNLMLKPYPQPFTILQNFRPFIWESHNSMSMIASFENLVPLFFLVLMIFNYIRIKKFRSYININPFIVFNIIYVITCLVLFSFSSNVGDLSRRHIYYYPQIIIIGFISLSFLKNKKLNISDYKTSKLKN